MLAVDLHFAKSHVFAILEVVWIDDSFNFLLLFIYHVVRSSEVTLLKCVSGWTVTEEQVRWLSTLVEIQVSFVVFVLLLGKDHFFGLWLIIVSGG